jgi:hypothetical protein
MNRRNSKTAKAVKPGIGKKPVPLIPEWQKPGSQNREFVEAAKSLKP